MKRSLLLFALVACGGTDSPATAPLMCADFAYCSTYEVNQYNGTIDTPAGGAIADGTYRLAYMVNPASANQDNNSFGDYGEGYRFEGGSYVDSSIQGRGTYAVSGTTLTLVEQAQCDLGKEGDAFASTVTTPYTATADRLVFFDDVQSGSTHWTAMRVFLKVDDLCETVSDAPTTPGDSYRCTVINCACGQSNGGDIPACS